MNQKYAFDLLYFDGGLAEGCVEGVIAVGGIVSATAGGISDEFGAPSVNPSVNGCIYSVASFSDSRMTPPGARSLVLIASFHARDN